MCAPRLQWPEVAACECVSTVRRSGLLLGNNDAAYLGEAQGVGPSAGRAYPLTEGRRHKAPGRAAGAVGRRPPPRVLLASTMQRDSPATVREMSRACQACARQAMRALCQCTTCQYARAHACMEDVHMLHAHVATGEPESTRRDAALPSQAPGRRLRPASCICTL